jgi:hypothetical protein
MREIDIGMIIKAARCAADKHRMQRRKDADASPYINHPIAVADKTCNLRDIAAKPPADWSAQRKADYFDWAGEVVAGLRGSHAMLEELFDQAWRLKEGS